MVHERTGTISERDSQLTSRHSPQFALGDPVRLVYSEVNCYKEQTVCLQEVDFRLYVFKSLVYSCQTFYVLTVLPNLYFVQVIKIF